MNSRLVLTAALAMALLGAYLHGQGGQQPSKLSLVKVADNMYAVHNAGVPGNSTALITPEGIVLVDDKFEVDHDNILAQLKTVTSQPIRYVINTHHHGDHSGGNAKMLAMNVQLVANERAWQNMMDGGLPGAPSVTFDTRATLHVGGARIELYYFGRGHTNGDIVVYFPAQRAIASGDLFTYGLSQLIDYGNGGSAKEWTRTLDAALALDFDAVVPGHGDVTTKAEMRKFRDSTLAVRTRVHDMIVQKKSRDEIVGVLVSEFKWAQGVATRNLDGMMIELQ